MASPDDPLGGAGMRRRHSSQDDGDDGSTVNGLHDGIQTGTHTVAAAPRRSMSDTMRPDIRSSAIDVPLHAPRSSLDQSPRVSFSQDAGRRSAVSGKKRKSDEFVQDTDGADDRPRSRPPPLDTRASASTTHGNVLGAGTVRSPTSLASPPDGSRARFANKSPQGRNRGMSLRSSLFARNFNQRPHSGDDSVIELQNVGSSSVDRRPQTAKKGSQPSVTVSPVIEEESLPDLTRISSRRKGLRGVSALPNYQQWAQKQATRHLPLERISETYQRARKLILRIQEMPPSKDGRRIPLNPSRNDALVDERTGRPYISNIIRSSKYNAWNFVPRQLFAQFSKLANAYFLCV